MTTAMQLKPAPNLEDEFRQAIADAGLHPPDSINADGRLHRFASNGKRRDQAGWYVPLQAITTPAA